MPNATPEQWQNQADRRGAQTTRNPGMGCGSGACVKVTTVADGVVLTSTLGDDKGRVEYNHAEWAQFVTDVQAGVYNPTVLVATA